MNSLTFIPTKKTAFRLFVLIIAIFIIGAFLYPVISDDGANRASAAAGDRPLFGWAWSDNFGWISFNSKNDHSELLSGTQEANFAYGVIANSGNELSGYAWSDNIGWVSFNENSGCPSSPCRAKIAGNKLQGWAFAISNGGGWDGWVSLGDDNPGDGFGYGITLNDPNFIGFAWDASKNDPGDAGEQAIGSGWITFNHAFGGVSFSPQCSDGVDNDKDGLVDYDGGDTDCDSGNDNSEGGGGGGGWQCSDGIDNEDPEDTLADRDDPGCHTDGDASNPDSYNPNDNNEIDVPQCNDGIDNDNNGCADFTNGDTGCTSSSDMIESGGSCPVITPQCSDTIDNADLEDEVADKADPGCYDTGGYDPLDNDEKDTLPQCSNFFDDDGDGNVDYPDDPGCSSASDNREFNIGFEEI
jgi:hypothetical protein